MGVGSAPWPVGFLSSVNTKNPVAVLAALALCLLGALVIAPVDFFRRRRR